ncbi:unnamed protein product [Closterium sp. NIES-54]
MGTRLLLALATTKASALRGCTSTSTTATATATTTSATAAAASTTAAAASATSAAASTTATAATEAPTPGTRVFWGNRVVEALTMRPAPSRLPRPGT